MKRLTILIAVMGMVLALGSTAHAQSAVTNTPQDGYGGPYRLIFFIEARTPATHTNIVHYNEYVTYKVAEVPKLNSITGATWRAIVSTKTVDARDNTETNPTNPNHKSWPIYNLGGIRVSNNNIDLWSSHVLDDILTNEFGSRIYPNGQSQAKIMTGTQLNGTKDGENYVGQDFPDRGDHNVMGSYNWPQGSWIALQSGYTPHNFSVMVLSSVLGGGPSGTRVGIK
jgi:hypothetical protein